MSNFRLVMPDSYANIKTYAERYVNQLQTGLQSGIIKQNPDDEALLIYFDVASVAELIRQGGADCTYLAGVLGIHENQTTGIEEFTISLLCTDKYGEILDAHKNGSLNGQEVWPYRALVSDFGAVLP